MYSHIKNEKLSKMAAIILVMGPLMLSAQVNNTAAMAQSNDAELLWYIILAFMAVLLFAILILGNVLINLVKVSVAKNATKTAALILLLLISATMFARDNAPVGAVQTSGTPINWNMLMALCVLLAETFTIVVFLIRIGALIETLSDKKEQKPAFEFHFPKFFDSINASVPIAREKDILLDHNYDGIRELDNNLPPWWKYSFYLSIVFAVCYLSYYHLLGGPTSVDEYNADVRQAQIQIDEYNRNNAGKVDENKVTMADAGGIAEGKETFESNCAACHGHFAEGVVGPNLTDDYWLHGGELNDLFKTVKYGWPAKGMKSWQADLNAAQIRNVISYIKTLHGTNPANAKAAQGDLYAPLQNDTLQTSADSSKMMKI